MNQLNLKQLQIHIPVVGWLLILGHAIYLALGVFIFLLLGGIGLAVQDSVATPVLIITALAAAFLLVIFGLPGLAAGIGLLMHKNWGRILSFVIAILELFIFPIGTLIGLYALFVLAQDDAAEYFGAPAAPVVIQQPAAPAAIQEPAAPTVTQEPTAPAAEPHKQSN